MIQWISADELNHWCDLPFTTISLQLCASSCIYVSYHRPREGRNIVGQAMNPMQMQSWFVEIQREASYLEFPKAYQKVRVCIQIATVQQPQSLLQKPLLSLTDLLQMKREGSLQVPIYTCRLLDIQNIWRGLAGKKGLPGNPGPFRAAVWGLLQYPTEPSVTADITRQVKDLSPSPIHCSRVLQSRIFHWGSWNRLAYIGTVLGQL